MLRIVIATLWAVCVIAGVTSSVTSGVASGGEEAPAGRTFYEGPAYEGLRFLGLNEAGAEQWLREQDDALVIRVRRGKYAQRPYEPDGTTKAPTQTPVESFFLDRTEVTNAQFCRFLNAKAEHLAAKAYEEKVRAWLGKAHPDLIRRAQERRPWVPAEGRAKYPVVDATGFGALAYAEWVGGRFPTQTEWEKAAGGVEGRIYPWGDAPPDEKRANFAHGRLGGLKPVGSFPLGAGPYGHLDMAGNAYDRVIERRDWIRARPVMLKGGAWLTRHPLNLRVLDMCMQPMEVADRSVGLRVAMVDPHPKRPDVKRESRPQLRIAADFDDAVEEAVTRNVPIFLSLQYDTCGQCDRIRAQLFRDPAFLRYCNEHVVVLIGHQPGHAGRDGHAAHAQDHCPLYPGLECWQHYRIFQRAVGLVGGFRVSPGNFVLDPHEVHGALRRKPAAPPPDALFLTKEAQLPKWGGGTARYIDALKGAQIQLRGRHPKGSDENTQGGEKKTGLVDAKYAGRLKQAVADYEQFGNVDDMMRWVPGLCRVPTLKIRDSQSDDAETHGGKLFWLFAKHRDAYLKVAEGEDQPVGQVLVKEAWSVAAGEAPPTKGGHKGLNEVVTTVERDGKKFHASQKSALYVLLKLGEDDEDSDAGWIYGTLTPDGKTVTSAGRVASCMACHQQSQTDRLFGLAK